MNVSDAVEQFLEGYFGTNPRSEKTRSAYRIDLDQFRDFVGPSTILCDVKPPLLEAWARTLSLRPYASASIRRKFATVRVFFLYWTRREVIPSSPVWKLRLSLRKEISLPRSLCPADARLLIINAWAQRDAKGTVGEVQAYRRLRDLAIVEVLFTTGMRVGELVKLRVDDWHHGESTLLVRGKGSRERLAFLPDDRSLRAMKLYLEVRPKMRSESNALFLNASRRPLSEQGVAIILTRLAKDAGIAIRVTPHMLRHTLATLLLRYGADIRIVQEVLGHASLSTTQRYVHVAKDHLFATLQARHPNMHLGIRI